MKRILSLLLLILVGFAAYSCDDSETDNSQENMLAYLLQSNETDQGEELTTVEGILSDGSGTPLANHTLSASQTSVSAQSTVFAMASSNSTTYTTKTNSAGEYTLKIPVGSFSVTVTDSSGNEVGSFSLTVSDTNGATVADEENVGVTATVTSNTDDSEVSRDLECGKPYVLSTKGGYTLLYTQLYMNQFSTPLGDCNPTTVTTSSSSGETGYTFTYDENGILQGLTGASSSENFEFTFTYGSSGYLSKIETEGDLNGTASSGIQTYSYDTVGRLVKIETENNGVSTMDIVFSYSDATDHFPVTQTQTTRDAEGTVTSTRTDTVATTYTADSAGRLTSYTGSSSSVSGSDPAEEETEEVTLTYTSAGYPKTVVSEVTSAGETKTYTTTYTYNSAGNVTEYNMSNPFGDQISTFTYDSQGRISGKEDVSVTYDYSTTATFGYK